MNYKVEDIREYHKNCSLSSGCMSHGDIQILLCEVDSLQKQLSTALSEKERTEKERNLAITKLGEVSRELGYTQAQLNAVSEAAKRYSNAHDGCSIRHESMEAATNYIKTNKELLTALSRESALQNQVYNLQATICDMEDKESMLIDNKRLREERSAYREALDKIAKLPAMNSFRCDVIARQALDRGPEEPVGRDVTREELAEEINTTLMRRRYNTLNERNEAIADHLLNTFRVERR